MEMNGSRRSFIDWQKEGSLSEMVIYHLYVSNIPVGILYSTYNTYRAFIPELL
jgi:hypothetical protein